MFRICFPVAAAPASPVWKVSRISSTMLEPSAEKSTNSSSLSASARKRVHFSQLRTWMTILTIWSIMSAMYRSDEITSSPWKSTASPCSWMLASLSSSSGTGAATTFSSTSARRFSLIASFLVMTVPRRSFDSAVLYAVAARFHRSASATAASLSSVTCASCFLSAASSSCAPNHRMQRVTKVSTVCAFGASAGATLSLLITSSEAF
mmetsp:Transcript_3427/g.10256  ORF Transcript_3427/g.10256 Transcript_3427/m.10256 type:complete len:207 (-) Transcript_3427:19-639(-)